MGDEDEGVSLSMLRLIDAQLRYYYKIPQSELDSAPDEQWAEWWRDLQLIREQEKGENG